MKKLLAKSYIRTSLFVIAGIVLGWLLFHHSAPSPVKTEQTQSHPQKTIWTCAMHPQIRMDHPGKCPICGMTLIPLSQVTNVVDSNAVVMTPDAVQLANIQTSVVMRGNAVKELHLYGKIVPDEQLVQTLPAFVSGRIERLNLNFTGESVAKGEPIASIYSPDLVTAQKELLEAAKMQKNYPNLLPAAKEKLKEWKLTDNQIARIESSGQIKNNIEVISPISGVVLDKKVNVGDYVSTGEPLYEIANLSRVWVLFDAYENDLPWLKVGDIISFTTESMPGETFRGRISFIDPVVNPDTRTASVRVEVENPGDNLKPGMFVTGDSRSVLSGNNELIIPQSAVLWTGTRSLVYIKTPDAADPAFVMREITLGPSVNNGYVVLAGLNEGDTIVTNGTFSVDAAAQLAGKPNMMSSDIKSTKKSPGMAAMPGM
ncbi:efflux RND transporter periplasmic adaptor subunit [Microbacter margulisiae]|uniref:Cu(I)/Ag(I) efflux system membrane fusion protein n=1 Tax=Microbacter margulisiae TaxID=1350067 RepID=A0A7W5H028_9PORP|nr:efflux RND transporter periplasmic adaptor subunit [Microbacter margulisiae]MBB3186078.1 Cu(I)/Ag(I) efflux system membrane fusion protein [Microbacter margulisiae]